jgi:hypothetical protein
LTKGGDNARFEIPDSNVIQYRFDEFRAGTDLDKEDFGTKPSADSGTNASAHARRCYGL